jgi:hypothetical protein
MLPRSNREPKHKENRSGPKGKALRGHPEGFLGGLTLLSIDAVERSKD